MHYILIALTIAMALFQKYRRNAGWTDAFLMSILFCLVGISGLWAFTGHFFVADKVAQGIGWPTGSPFQQEIAFTNLGIGILGILCLWLRNGFWTATVIMSSTFLLGASYVHIKDMIEKGNMNPLNSGLILYIDIFIPLFAIALLITKHYVDKKSTKIK